VLLSCISACGRCCYCRERQYGQCIGGGGWIFGHLIERDKDLRRYRIEPVAAELLSGAVERARAAGLVAGRGSAVA
jgi:threonine dehydrogenase-like Zn-dependent dehydrogenase